MPSRWAASVAIVDLPVPVAPPTSSTIGTSRCWSACSRRSRRIVRVPSVSPSSSTASVAAGRGRADARPCAMRSASASRASSYARVVRQPRGRERARHQALRPRRAFVAAERERCQIATGVHATLTGTRCIASTATRSNASSRSGSPGSGDDVVRGDDDSDPAAMRLLGDHVDGSGLQLDHERLGIDLVELRAQRRAIGEHGRHVRDPSAVDLLEMAGKPGRVRSPARCRTTRLARRESTRAASGGGRCESPRSRDGPTRRLRAATARLRSSSAMVTMTRSARRAR